jgi:hypothetical protein
MHIRGGACRMNQCCGENARVVEDSVLGSLPVGVRKDALDLDLFFGRLFQEPDISCAAG